MSQLPGGACAKDSDCRYLANTVCALKKVRKKHKGGGGNRSGEGDRRPGRYPFIKVKVCQCMDGYQPIPGEYTGHCFRMTSQYD